MPNDKCLVNDGERIDSLGHEGLRIIQDPLAPCFAIDAVILADFVRLKPGDKVIDLGCGTGIIPLLLTLKHAASQIIGVELMPKMADMAKRSVALNALQEQIFIREGDIREATAVFGSSVCQVITANPPYFPIGQGRVSDSPLWAAARSEKHCTSSQLIAEASRLLVPLGRCYLVQRAARLSEIIALLEVNGLFPDRLRMVQPYQDADANLFLIEAIKGKRRELRIPPPLIVYARPNIYSAEMQKIYQGE